MATQTPSDAKVAVSTVAVTKISVRDRLKYATLWIDGDTGLLVIQSSHGDWQYRWSHPGMEFIEFLAELDMEYLGCKCLGAALHVHSDMLTIEAIRDEIIQGRRSGWLSGKEAREEWTYVEFYEGFGTFAEWCDETSLPDAYEFSRKQVDPSWRQFWDKVWVPLVQPALQSIQA